MAILKALPLGKKLTIAIDLDGTVADCAEVDFKKADVNPQELMKATPRPGAVQSVKKLFKAGHTIVFFTSRGKSNKTISERWLRKHGFPFHHVEMDKFVAHVYIDDRAVNGCDWKRVMKELKNPKLPGRLARKRGMI